MRGAGVLLFVLAVAAALNGCVVRADLPIHCLGTQVAGKWVFEKSAAKYDSSETCGYHAPDVNALHFKNPEHKFQVAEKISFTLVIPNHVKDDNGKTIGHWSMIYDEGFEVVIDGWTYFAFNKYMPKKHTSLNSEDVNDYISYCDKTMVGWFRSPHLKKWGCYRGYQVARLRFRETEAEVTEDDTPTSTTAPHSQSLSPSPSPVSSSSSRSSPAPSSTNAPRLLPFNPNHVVSPFAFSPSSTEAHPPGTSGNLNVKPTAFYELQPHTPETLREHRSAVVSRIPSPPKDSVWQPNYQFVEMNNRDSRSTWRAGVADQFLGKRMSEMMRMLGHSRFNKFGSNNEDHAWGSGTAYLTTASKTSGVGAGDGRLGPHTVTPPAHVVNPAEYIREHARLPKDFSWIKFDSPVRNQGECGSCYSMAAMTVAEVRLRIRTQMKDKTLLSAQHVLSCSRENQGCEGGYPVLVGKFATEHGLVPEACAPYKASDIDCDSLMFTSSKCAKKRLFAKNYRYVGGYYGSCTELAMMKEIQRAGPIIVALQAPSSLFYYSGGIFTGPPPKHEGRPRKGFRMWEQTNHAVVAMGWGEENGHRYWIIKNTWGPHWGESGYFRMQRGTDECGVESMASTFDIIA
jgi:hypothetical protein